MISIVADLQQKKESRIGTTSVRLRSMGSFAMLVCGGDLWHAGYNPDLVPAECFVQRVWITDEKNVSLAAAATPRRVMN